MTPELALVAIVVLLWGPTTVWLAYRSIRGNQRDTFQRYAGEARLEVTPGARPADVALVQLVDHEAFWVCGGCKSINRPTSRRCYGCRLDRGAKPGKAIDEAAAATGVPVMVHPVAAAARRSAAMPPTPTPPTPVGSLTVGVLAAPVVITEARREEPASATLAVVPPGSAVTPRAPGVALPAGVRRVAPPSVREPDAAPVHPAVVSSGEVCPHLRLENDPFTWFVFPHPANLCHAQVNETGGRRSLIRLLPSRLGAGRPQVIRPDVQQGLCLTGSFPQCARYRSVQAEVDRPAATAAAWTSAYADEAAAEPGTSVAAAPDSTSPGQQTAIPETAIPEPATGAAPASPVKAPASGPGAPRRRQRRVSDPVEVVGGGSPAKAGGATAGRPRSRTKPTAQAGEGDDPSAADSRDVADAR